MGALTEALIGKTAEEKRAILAQSIKLKKAGKADAEKAVEQGLANAAITQAKGGGTYTVQSGDSLFSIAGSELGDQRFFEALSAANNGLTSLRPGMTINLPRVRSATGYSPTVSAEGFEAITGQPSGVIPGPKEPINQIADTLDVPTSSVPQVATASVTGAGAAQPNIQPSTASLTGSNNIQPNTTAVASLTGANNIQTSTQALTPRQTESARLTGQALNLGAAPYDPTTGKYTAISEDVLNVFGVSPQNQELYQSTLQQVNSGGIPEVISDTTRTLLGQSESALAQKGYQWTGGNWVLSSGGTNTVSGDGDIYGGEIIPESTYQSARKGRTTRTSSSAPRPQSFDPYAAVSRATSWRVGFG